MATMQHTMTLLASPLFAMCDASPAVEHSTKGILRFASCASRRASRTHPLKPALLCPRALARVRGRVQAANISIAKRFGNVSFFRCLSILPAWFRTCFIPLAPWSPQPSPEAAPAYVLPPICFVLRMDSPPRAPDR